MKQTRCGCARSSPRGAPGEAGRGGRNDIPYVRRLDLLRQLRLVWWSLRLPGRCVLDDESVRTRLLDDQAELSDLGRKGAQAMSGGYRRIDPQKLLAGETDFHTTDRVCAPPAGERPAGLIYDVHLGRHFVRFLFSEIDGEPRTTAIWKPRPPKALKPALLRKYRRERKAFAVEVAKQFGWTLPIIDRFGGAPRVIEVVHPGGVDTMDPPVPYREAVLH